MNRRLFLASLAASALTAGLDKRGLSKRGLGATSGGVPRIAPLETEAARLTGAMMSVFWDNGSKMFRAPVLSSETVSSDELHDRGETLWPSLLGMHALIEGEKAHPGRYAGQIASVFNGLQQYYSDELHAYTSWLQFPGNTDAYFDDNAWVVIVFVEAYTACRRSDPSNAARYLARAKVVMAGYLVKNYDFSGAPGGMRWGTDTTKSNTSDRCASSTAGVALASLMMARARVDAPFHTRFGHDVLRWISRHLLDKDGLVMDALTPPNWEVRPVKWTYNTGVPMRAYVEHYRLTQSAESLEMATKLARAAIDQNLGLFDRKVAHVSKRIYWDGVYFVHYLVDGLLQVARETPDAQLATAIDAIARGTALYVQTFLQDPTDGFYWRNMRLYAIGEAQLASWEQWSGQVTAPQYDESERSKEARFQSVAVKDRPLVKTLLANGGAARLFWMAAATPSKEVPK